MQHERNCPVKVWDFKGFQEGEQTTETSAELRQYQQAMETYVELAQLLELEVDTATQSTLDMLCDAGHKTTQTTLSHQHQERGGESLPHKRLSLHNHSPQVLTLPPPPRLGAQPSRQ
ncbi:hypothetical protein PR048_008412 [Dryococelus australis]|uniref:Uncharacterized protein n=1 Tax=Dryococelus australis TaxID=614101 RepID=A0ABQ9HX15_9NEOP|nr:hypothetical protein PR048_008412 [Dryococelus australis]